MPICKYLILFYVYVVSLLIIAFYRSCFVLLQNPPSNAAQNKNYNIILRQCNIIVYFLGTDLMFLSQLGARLFTSYRGYLNFCVSETEKLGMKKPYIVSTIKTTLIHAPTNGFILQVINKDYSNILARTWPVSTAIFSSTPTYFKKAKFH